MDGGYDIEVGTVLDLLTLLLVNVGGHGRTWWTTALEACRSIIRRVRENNDVGRARDNVQRHYTTRGTVRILTACLGTPRASSPEPTAPTISPLQKRT